MRNPLKLFAINLSENTTKNIISVYPTLVFRKQRKVTLSTKTNIFETSVTPFENIVESFCLRECGTKLGTLSYYGDFHIMPVA